MKDNYRNYEIVSKTPIVYFHHWEGDIRKVRIVGCDFDKRVDLVCEETGEEFQYKWGYVFNTYEEAVSHRDFDVDSWLEDRIKYVGPDCINPWKLLLSNKNYAMYKKLYRKEETNKTQWYVAVNDESYYTSTKFTRFKDALKYFVKLDFSNLDYASIGEQNSGMRLLHFDGNTLYFSIVSGDDYVLKSRPVGKEVTYKEWRKKNV